MMIDDFVKLHYFNPGHEHAVLNGSPYYTAPANVVQMAADLSFLPAWYASEEDFILVNNDFDFSFYTKIAAIFGNFPQPVGTKDLDLQKNYQVDLWGVSPQGIHFFQVLGNERDLKFRLPEWDNRFCYLNSRMAARDCLAAMVDQMPEINRLLLPEIIGNMDDLRQVIADRKYRWLVKAPFSSSGRGLLWIPAEGLTRTEEQILAGFFRRQKEICAERVLNKTIDFAMEFMADGRGKAEFRGLSYFQTNQKGAYEGNCLQSQQSISSLLTDKVGTELIDKVQAFLESYLSVRYASLYSGCIGVDMMIYEEEGRLKLHPCVEINMRYNMGLLSVSLFDRYVHPDSSGMFTVDFNPQPGSMVLFDKQMQSENPLILRDGKIWSGYLSLCPVTDQTKYVAYLLINRS